MSHELFLKQFHLGISQLKEDVETDVNANADNKLLTKFVKKDAFLPFTMAAPVIHRPENQ